MKIKAEKRLLAMLMVMIMVISFIPVNALAASLFTTTVLDGKVSISGDGTSGLGTGTNTNDVVTVTAKPEVNSCTGAITKKDHTVTVSNATADETLTLSFNYEASNFGGFTVAGTDKAAAPKGSWGGQLAPGASLTIVLTSPDTDTEATLVLSNFELQDDSAKIVTVQPGTNGTVKVNDTAITAVTEVTTTFADGVTLSATPASGYVFLGWVDSNYNILASEATTTIQPKTDMAVYAAFVANDQTAYWQGGGKLHTDLNTAIAAAQASDGLVVLLKNATLSGSYTIPAGVTLLIPHDDKQSMYGADPALADNGTKWAVPSAYRTLTLADNAKLTVNGTMELAAMHYIAAGSQTTGGQVYGKFAHVVLGKNATIDVNGTLYVWGYITGDGVVTAYSGGTIYEKMQITDYRGGTITSLLALTHKGEKLFPFNQYYCQNVETREVIHAGATLMAHAGVYVSAPESSAIAFVGGASAMFGLASGYVVKTYDAERDRLCIDVYGNASLNSISLSVGDQSISSADFRLGINNNISLGIHSGVTQINQDLVLQAGVEVYVDREATLYNTKEVYVMDAEDWGTFARGKTIIPVNWTVANGSKVIRTGVTDAIVDINGTILNGGQIYTTGSESVISSEKTGVLILQTSPNSTGSLSFVTDNVRDNIGMIGKGSAWTTVACTAPVLVNGNGSTVTVTGVQYDSYIYDSILDQWISKNIYNNGSGYTPVLSFNANGGSGSVASLNIPFLNIAGAFAQTGVMQPLSVALPDSSFVREGYTFIGWSADSAATGADFIPGDYVVFSQDHTLYAVWSANKYALVIDGVSQEVPFGSDLSAYIPAAPTKDGYTFAGWTVTTADGTPITAPATMPAYDVIFTANWEQIKSYTLTFLDENGDVLGEYSYEAGQQVTATYPAYTKENYVITWSAEIPATLTGDVEISAIATPNVYTITYIVDGAEAGDDQATESNNWTVSLLKPTKTGFTFMGWAYAADTAADITADVAELALTGDVTLYAVWSANAYTVTFNGVGEPIVLTYAYGDAITAPADPEMEGYTFTGWANRDDGSDVPATMPAEDLIFDAQWEQIVYTLSWDVDGDGDVDSTTTVAHNGYVGTLPEAVVPGMTATIVYTLNGWTDANGTAVDASTVVTGDMTITANIVASDRYYYLAGLIDGEWGEVEANKMIPNGDGTYTFTVHLNPGSWEFKVRSGDAWYGCSNTTIENNTNGYKYNFYGDNDNCVFKSTEAATYTFVWDTADNSLIVDYVPDHVHVYNATFNWSNYNTACEVTLTCDCNSSFTYACSVSAVEGGSEILFTATYGEYSESISVDDYSTRAIYFDNSNTNWDNVYAYYWIYSQGAGPVQWPGTAMTKVEGTDNLYVVIVPADCDYIIFNNGTGGIGNQSNDQPIPTNGCNTAVWYASDDIRWGYNEPASFAITFEVDGEIVDAFGYRYGAAIDWDILDGAVTKPEKEGYTFAGYDYTNVPAYVNGDITITGSFTVNSYIVTWIVDGVGTQETYNYGETPVFTGSTDKAQDGCTVYTFDGWDKEIVAVNGNITYTATYTESLSHTAGETVVENVVVGDCVTNSSYDNVVYCSVCGEELSRDTVVTTAPGHTDGEKVIENNVNPDCTNSGSYDEVIYCAVCGAEVSRTSVFVPEKGHSYNAVVTDPTCTEDGYTTYTCSVCGDSYTDDEVAALGHTAGETVVENVVVGDCVTNSSYDNVVYCSVCGEELSRDTVVTTAPGHTDGEKVIENNVAADCTNPGSYDEVIYCTICGAEVSRTNVYVPELGHTAGETVVENEVAADCTNPGSYDNVVYCSVCDEELSRVTVPVDALGHTAGEIVVENEVAADCTNPGSYDNVVYCSVCGEELSRVTVPVDALGHAWGEPYYNWGREYGKPTPVQPYSWGNVGRYCPQCGKSETVMDHNLDSEIVSEGTCKTLNYVKFIAKFPSVDWAPDGIIYTPIDYNPNIHEDELTYINNGDTHTALYPCCNSVIIDSEAHSYSVGNYTCVCGAIFSGIFEDTNGDLYYVENGVAIENKGLVQAIDENGLKIYYYFGCGIEGCSAGDACQGNFKAQKSCRHYAGITNGYLVEGGYTIGDDGIIEHAENLQGIQTLDGTKYYLIDGVKVAIGLVKVDGEYYYARSNGALVIGQDYYISKTNGLTYNGEAITKGSYTFDADGKIVWAEPKNGIYAEDGSLYYYVDGVRNYAGLIIYTGDLNNADGTVTEGVYDNAMIYVNTKGEVKNSCTYWISKNNGLIEKNRAFTFDANGIVVEDEKNGFYFEDGFWYYYVDGSKNYAGLIWCDGPEGNDPGYYYINSKCQLITDCTYWISKNNGYMSNQAYTFGVNGKMEQVTNDSDELLEGFVEENGELYYYENGIKTYAGLILVDGNYYYVNSKCQVIRDCTYWISKNNGYMKNGSYTFDANGVMVTE